MSAGIPVVATPVSGIPEAITEDEEGSLVPGGNVEALKDAIRRVLSDLELREAMRFRDRASFDACFNGNAVFANLESTYRVLVVLSVRSG